MDAASRRNRASCQNDMTGTHFGRIGVILLGALIATSSCRSTGAKPTFDRMQRAACNGDAEAFFASVDLESILDNVIRRRGAPFGREVVRGVLLRAVREWKTDISTRRAAGFICGWSVVAIEDRASLQRLEVLALSGGTKYLWFRRTTDGAIMVDYESLNASEGAIQ
jgi:hypothetical protein